MGDILNALQLYKQGILRLKPQNLCWVLQHRTLGHQQTSRPSPSLFNSFLTMSMTQHEKNHFLQKFLGRNNIQLYWW